MENKSFKKPNSDVRSEERIVSDQLLEVDLVYPSPNNEQSDEVDPDCEIIKYVRKSSNVPEEWK